MAKSFYPEQSSRLSRACLEYAPVVPGHNWGLEIDMDAYTKAARSACQGKGTGVVQEGLAG
jgi:hypothetical protein